MEKLEESYQTIGDLKANAREGEVKLESFKRKYQDVAQINEELQSLVEECS